MQPSSRKNKKHRKKSPMIHRSFGVRRGRDTKEIEKEIKDSKNSINRRELDNREN